MRTNLIWILNLIFPKETIIESFVFTLPRIDDKVITFLNKVKVRKDLRISR